MQSLLTTAIELAAATFILLMIVDFAAGLAAAWQNAGIKVQTQTESVAQEQAIAPQAEITPDPWMLPMSETAIALPSEQPTVKQLLLPPARVQIATLEWIERNMPAAEIYAAQMPNVIELAKARLPKVVAPVVQLATRQQLQSSGIRKLKQLAREIKLSGYSNMRVAQLAAALEGKVATHQLAA